MTDGVLRAWAALGAPRSPGSRTEVAEGGFQGLLCIHGRLPAPSLDITKGAGGAHSLSGGWDHVCLPFSRPSTGDLRQVSAELQARRLLVILPSMLL